MLFLLSRRSFYPLLLFIGANLVISMPAPPSSRRSSEDDEAGFSDVPKILEIQLPLRIATKEDLVAWARYVMGLMASRINITLTTVKESRMVGETEKMSKRIQQSLPVTNSGYRYFDGSSIDGYFAKSFENTRYAENVRNVASVVDREKIPVRIVENGELSREKAYPQLPTEMVDGRSSFNDRQPIFRPIFDGTIPLDAPSIPKPGGIKEPDAKDSFDAKSFSKTGDRQLFVPQFPNFGPAIELRPNDIFPDTNSVSPPTRAYLPATTTTALTSDNLEFPFVARYLFDNVEGNVSSNVDPPLFAGDEIASPRNVPLVPSRNASSVTSLPFKVPFEAVITFETPRNTEGGKYSVAPSKDDSPPGDRFPPYFDTSSHASTNESGQRINVVLDEGQPIEAGKEERKKQEKKKEEEISKRRKSEKNRAASLARLIESLVALRSRNGTLATNLVPPVPLREQASTQRSPERERAPPPTRTQLYSTENPVVSKNDVDVSKFDVSIS